MTTQESSAPKAAPMEHFVNQAPFDPKSIENLTPEQEAVFLASAKKADVVEIQTPQDCGDMWCLFAADLSFYALSRKSWRPMRWKHGIQNTFMHHHRVSISSTRMSLSVPLFTSTRRNSI